MEACLFCSITLPEESGSSSGGRVPPDDYETEIFGEVPEGQVLDFSYVTCEACNTRLWKEQAVHFRQLGTDPLLIERQEYMWTIESKYARQLLAEGKELPAGNWHRFESEQQVVKQPKRKKKA